MGHWIGPKRTHTLTIAVAGAVLATLAIMAIATLIFYNRAR